MERSGGEPQQLIAAKLVAIDVERRRVEEQLVVGVSRQKLGRRDDHAPAVRRFEADVERNARAERQRALKRCRFHGAGEVEGQICRRVHSALAARWIGA